MDLQTTVIPVQMFAQHWCVLLSFVCTLIVCTLKVFSLSSQNMIVGVKQSMFGSKPILGSPVDVPVILPLLWHLPAPPQAVGQC